MDLRYALLTVFLFFSFSGVLCSQVVLNGRVADPSGEPLAFVTVVVDGGSQPGTLTDIEGRFRVEVSRPVDTLLFRYVGYATLALGRNAWSSGGPLEVVLEPTGFDLPEATIFAGENPADILMRKVIANRGRNNPENRRAYRCQTYNKIVIDALPNREIYDQSLAGKDTTTEEAREALQNFRALDSSMQVHHAFLMESVTERAYLRPSQVKERVLLNRVSGAPKAGIVALSNMVQPFTFYGDYLQILDKNFVNPVSPGSPDRYFFYLEDTLFTERDTVWVVAFHPRKGKVFTGLEGVLHIHSDAYGVQNVRAWPADTGNLEIHIEQSYRRVAGQWFPEQLNFELILRKYPAEYIGIQASGRSYIADVVIDPPLRVGHFNPDQPLQLLSDAHAQPDSAWLTWRALAPLSDKEWRTYAWLDQVGKQERLDRVFQFMDYLVSGRLPVAGPLSIDLRRLLRANHWEGTRLGVGLTNAQPRPLVQSRRLEASAYVGYGVRDKEFKYGGSVLWRINRNWKTQLSAGWQHDLAEPGTLFELSRYQLVDRFLYARRLDRVEEGWLTLGSRLLKGAEAWATLRNQRVSPLYDYSFTLADGSQAREFRFTEGTFALRYAPKETVRRFLGSTAGSIQKIPVVELAYTRGWKGLLNGEYDYERWTLALYQSVFLRRLGRSSWRIEAGLASGDAPIAKLFTLNAAPGGTRFGVFSVRNTFQSLPDTVFLSDRFVNIYLAQEIGPVLYRSKYSAPYLTLLQNASQGTLGRPERHGGSGFIAPERVLLESGVQLDNLAKINYLNAATLGVGGAVFYRWGGLRSTRWQENLSFRLAVRFNL